ncbi:hypothetical protein [Paenibacillus wynnii]|uniref:Butirosin biosynthesis protein H N-terminal domain-containing protein n=1 Tax=Paenibacillus wynnii TaxID=268407 RepID=A0A098M4Z2_9BACL|nr:hypothetical protein [Paenibacillus wynnii]KGE17103.1 hypothetical protein PWYN_20865 [Paenibacillus wynnii]
MRRELPIKIKHKINNQLCNAGFLCVILAYDNMQTWFYEHYVQLYYSFNKKVLSSKHKEMFLDFYGGWTEPRELFDINSLNRKDVESYDEHSFESIIGTGQYIYCYVDEYYIQNSKHNSHDILVYGYDDERRVFQVVGFKDGFFQGYEVDYDIFLKAFRSGVKLSKLFDTYHGINYFLCIEPRFDESTQYEFNTRNFMERVKEYVCCINTGKLNACDDLNHKMYQKEDNVFGIEVYECLIKEIEGCRKKLSLLDYRAFHTLYEHNVLMKERIEYLRFDLGEQEFTESLNELVKLSNEIRMLVMKYNFSPEDEVLERIIESTKKMYRMEKETYNAFYDAMCVSSNV